MDFLVVPTVTFRLLHVLVLLRHDRRSIMHVNVTQYPTAEWTAQQVVDAFPWDEVPRYLLRDRDGVYGRAFSKRVRGLGIEEVKTAPRSPWQNPYVERFNGTLRRELLDHVIVLGERHLRRLIGEYLSYYHEARCHLSLDKDSPHGREVQTPERGEVVAFPMVGGLHHRYERRAA
ncbi:MAG: integrase core domain-containing protein [Acidobacteriota bacterium]